MSLPEQLIEGVELDKTIMKFGAVRDLGRVVSELRLQIEGVEQSMDLLAPDNLEAPEGKAFRIMAIGPEDALHVQTQRSVYHNETVWGRIWPHDYDRYGGPKTKTPAGRWYFDGFRFEYNADRRVWLYNKEGWLRVLFEPGVSFEGIVPIDEFRD